MKPKNEPIRTERLSIRLLTDDEMRNLISEQSDEGMRQAYGEMLAGCLSHPEAREWYAVWSAFSADGVRVGDLSFKGISPDGTVEIGYGILPVFQGKGYATEAVRALVKWASAQPGVGRIEAEAEECNLPSLRVLEKAGFLPTGTRGEEGPRFVFGGRKK